MILSPVNTIWWAMLSSVGAGAVTVSVDEAGKCYLTFDSGSHPELPRDTVEISLALYNMLNAHVFQNKDMGVNVATIAPGSVAPAPVDKWELDLALSDSYITTTLDVAVNQMGFDSGLFRSYPKDFSLNSLALYSSQLRKAVADDAVNRLAMAPSNTSRTTDSPINKLALNPSNTSRNTDSAQNQVDVFNSLHRNYPHDNTVNRAALNPGTTSRTTDKAESRTDIFDSQHRKAVADAGGVSADIQPGDHTVVPLDEKKLLVSTEPGSHPAYTQQMTLNLIGFFFGDTSGEDETTFRDFGGQSESLESSDHPHVDEESLSYQLDLQLGEHLTDPQKIDRVQTLDSGEHLTDPQKIDRVQTLDSGEHLTDPQKIDRITSLDSGDHDIPDESSGEQLQSLDPGSMDVALVIKGDQVLATMPGEHVAVGIDKLGNVASFDSGDHPLVMIRFDETDITWDNVHWTWDNDEQ